MTRTKPPNPTLIENAVWVVAEPIGFSQYDFAFESSFECKHPYQLDSEVTAVARMGTAPDYPQRYAEMKSWGIRLVNSPAQYERSSYLPNWYPLIQEFTPRSVWFDATPSPEKVFEHFELPIFIKGERQTNKHSRAQSIISSEAQLTEVLAEWSSESILWWQKVVCREFLPLRPVAQDHGVELPKSYEFRSFWWKGVCVGIGKYWVAANYSITRDEYREVESIGKVVCERLDVPFLVIDFAQTMEGRWIVIECNDGQDSGYGGINRRSLWHNIIQHERR